MRTILLGGLLLMLGLVAAGCPVVSLDNEEQLNQQNGDGTGADSMAAEGGEGDGNTTAGEAESPSVWDVADDVYDTSWRETWEPNTPVQTGDDTSNGTNDPNDTGDGGDTGGNDGTGDGTGGDTGGDAGTNTGGDDGSSSGDDPNDTPGDNNAPAVRDPNDAVDQVVRQVVAAGVRCAMCVPLADEQLDMNGPISGEFGDCPTVGFADDGDSGLISMMFGYDDGCSGPLTGGIVLTGSVAIMYDQTATTIDLYFLEMPGGVKDIPGEIHGTYARSAAGASIAGMFTLDSDAAGAVGGNVSLAYSPDDVTTINSATWYADADGYAYDLTCASIVINPVIEQSFIPTGGTISFNVENPAGDPATLPVLVTFNAQSPTTSVVSVQIGDDPPFDYHVFGMGP